MNYALCIMHCKAFFEPPSNHLRTTSEAVKSQLRQKDGKKTKTTRKRDTPPPNRHRTSKHPILPQTVYIPYSAPLFLYGNLERAVPQEGHEKASSSVLSPVCRISSNGTTRHQYCYFAPLFTILFKTVITV